MAQWVKQYQLDGIDVDYEVRNNFLNDDRERKINK